MTNLLYKASIVTTPTAYGVGVLNSIKPAQSFGEELVTNGNFATDSDWSKGTGWTISGGSANCDGTGGSSIYQDISGVLNTTYIITLTISGYTSGTLQIGGSTNNLEVNSNGTFTHYRTWTSDTILYLKSKSGDGFNGSIDNVSVKEQINADFDFTRTSSATRVNPDYLIETVATDIPRLDYTNGTASILLEPQSTNVLPYSEDFSQSSWIKNDISIESGYLAPDGTNNAYKVTKTGSNAHLVDTISGGHTATKSIYAKTTSGTGTIILFNNVTTYFTITEEWQRFDNQQAGLDFFYAADFRGASTLTEIIIWGAQSEALTYPTSYIPTSGQSGGVTRAAETLNNAGNSDLINSTEGVLYFEGSALANDGTYREFGLSDGTSSKRVLISYVNSDNVVRANFDGMNGASNLLHTLTNATDFVKIAVVYKTNRFELWVNGIKVNQDVSGSTFPAGILTELNFNSGSTGSPFYGKTKTVAVFKEALSDTELACLTSTNNREIFLNYYYRMQYVGANTEALSCAEQTFNI